MLCTMLQSELKLNRKRRRSCDTAQEPNTTQTYKPRSFRKHTVFTRCVYCPLLCYLSFLLISSSGGMVRVLVSQAPGPFKAARGSCHSKEPVRFGSVPHFSKNNRFGSVRFGNSFSGSTRFGLRFSDASWLGPVRFGSVRFRVRFRPVPEFIVSVRPVRLGFLFLPSCCQTVRQRGVEAVAHVAFAPAYDSLFQSRFGSALDLTLSLSLCLSVSGPSCTTLSSLSSIPSFLSPLSLSLSHHGPATLGKGQIGSAIMGPLLFGYSR